MSIEAAVATRLMTALGHDRIYPDARWLKTDPQTGEAVLLAQLPVLMYRQTGGTGGDSLSDGRGALREDYFTLEVFAEGRNECSAVRDKLLDEFPGPVDADNPGGWATWGVPKTNGSALVHWATIDDPEAGAEFPESDVHLLFRYVRMVLTVQWYKGA